MTVVEDPPANGQRPVVYEQASAPLVASAQKLDVNSPDEKKRYRKRQKTWQEEAWRYYDECAEIWFGANFVANNLRKVRLCAASQPDVSEPPTPLEEPDPDDPEDDRAPLTDVERQAVDLVERLGHAEGGIGGIMASLGLNLSVPGEAVLVGSDPVGDGNERWKVYSTDEIIVNAAGQFAIRTSPGDRKGTPLDANSIAYRLWRNHPRWSDLADSAMRPLLDVVEELLILSRAIRASGRSRLAGAGLLLWPSEANLNGSAPVTDQSVSAQPVDPVLADLMQAMMTPIGDEGVAAAVVPLLLRLNSTYIDHVKHLVFERPIDPEMAKQREELRRRIATGLDIPAEVLLGVGDLNHWNAWIVDETAFKSHIEPLVLQICSSLTSEYLLPQLPDAGVGSDLLVWYDASALIGHPNRAQDANDAFDRYAISEDAYRRYKGFAEDDAPDDDEIQERVARKALERLGALRSGEVLGETTDVTAQEAVSPGIPATGPDAGQAPAAIAAAAVPAGKLARLGWKLAHRDRDLRTRLNSAADAAVFRALERAGATLRRHSSKDGTAKAMVRDVPNHLVCATLGQEVMLAFGVDTQLALEGEFDNLSMRFDREVQQAQKAFRDMVDQMDSEDAVDLEDLAQQQAEHRREAEGLLVAALLALTTERMFNPHPEAPPLGEHDVDMLVPPGYLREALAVAGGSPAPAALDGVVDAPAGGVFTGDLAAKVWNMLGIGPQGYEWIHGAPLRAFEPHERLDGVSFQDFTDPVLANDEGWPDVDFFQPGDHDGCTCDFAPLLGSTATAEGD